MLVRYALPSTVTLLSAALAASAGAAEYDRYAYVLATAPSSAAYIATGPYAAQTLGSGIKVTRLATGVYDVRFMGFAVPGKPGGNVQVTAYQTKAQCFIGNWRDEGSDFVINVRCHRIDGSANVDAKYSVSVVVR